MKAITFALSCLCCLGMLTAQAQKGKFEFNNPDALPLGEKEVAMLTSGYWRVYLDETESRGATLSTPKNISIYYDADGTFFYNGSEGSWEIVEGSYIVHHLEKEVQEEIKFGGVFSITAMKDTRKEPATLTMTKLLTSSHDMKRTLYLRTSSTLTHNKQTDTGSPYLYEGKLTEAKIDSLWNMEEDALFDAGFTVRPDQQLHIIASDTFYIIKLNAVDQRYQRISLH